MLSLTHLKYFRDAAMLGGIAPAAARNRIYGLYCLSIAFWSVFYCGWQLAESKDLALSLLRLVMAGALALSVVPAIFLVLFSYSLMNINLRRWFARPMRFKKN